MRKENDKEVSILFLCKQKLS